MRKVVGGMAVLGMLCLFAGGDSDRAYGQAKSKPAPAPTRKEAAKVGTIEVYKAKDGYRFRIKELDGKTIAMPTRGHEDKEDCLKSLEFIKATLDSVKPTEVKE
jgi:uncharacterized protein YegP (UPF0339 family)